MDTAMHILKVAIAVEVVFWALWIAAHGGLKDDATVAREFAADVEEYRRHLTSDERFDQQATRRVEDQR